MTGAVDTADAVVAGVVAGLADRGYAIVPRALPAAAVAALRARALALDAVGALAPARVGRGSGRDRRDDVRGDRIRWLDGGTPDPAEAIALAFLEDLRVACNRALMAGLAEYEGHFAVYPPGAAYARHRDRFRDSDARVISLVAYLNDDWREADGGELRLHLDHGAVEVVPRGGTAVCFRSELEHEVLPALRERLSIAAWFRRKS